MTLSGSGLDILLFEYTFGGKNQICIKFQCHAEEQSILCRSNGCLLYPTMAWIKLEMSMFQHLATGIEGLTAANLFEMLSTWSPLVFPQLVMNWLPLSGEQRRWVAWENRGTHSMPNLEARARLGKFLYLERILRYRIGLVNSDWRAPRLCLEMGAFQDQPIIEPGCLRGMRQS